MLKKGIKMFLKRKTKSTNMLVNDIKVFLKKKTTKRKIMIVEKINITLNKKNKGLLSTGKLIPKCGKIKPFLK